MMSNTRILSALALTLAVCAGTAGAQTSTPRVDQRQAVQQQRINSGYARGQLTAAEARRLTLQQRRIARAKARAKSDGYVTAAERRRIAQRQNAANRAIQRQRSDVQTR